MVAMRPPPDIMLETILMRPFSGTPLVEIGQNVLCWKDGKSALTDLYILRFITKGSS